MKIAPFITFLVLAAGCSKEQESEVEDALAFHEKYESVWYPPEYKNRYVEALKENDIQFFEKEENSTLWVVTLKENSKEVAIIRRGLFGIPPGEFSVSFQNKERQKLVENTLRSAGIEVEEGSYFENSYIKWRESDSQLADEILLSQFGYDRKRVIEAAKSHNK